MARPSQALSLPENLEAANVLIAGRYRVLARLGKGGAGSVYRVQELSSGQALALKRLSARAGKQLHALFEREYYTLSTLKHPNVVEVFEYGSDDHGPYYTMELLAGSDLSDQAPMAWQRACQVVIEAASALAPLHARRLIHRDVGPRNLWRTLDDSIKLIDFGALTPFGTPGDIVGTPPFVAPEAVQGQVLDQRADLYALGALLYWLVTGLHAFPARSLRDLPGLWASPYMPASRRLASLSRPDLPELPAELDALIEALLSRDPKARPSNTGDVIDRVRAIAGLSRDARPERAQLYLQQGAFVGREREQRHFQRRLQLAAGGTGGCTVIEARAGEGRSRMLSELAVHARVAGAAVMRVDAGLCDGVHGTALALAQKLLDTLPEHARAAVTPHASTLAHLSPKLAERLAAGTLTPMPTVAGEARARLHEALVDWFTEVSKKQQLVLLIDDLQRADEASVAFLLTLSLAAERHNMMMVVAYNSDTKNDPSPALKSLLQQGRRVLLRPLDGSAARELLSSLFGEVPHLVRMAERLHRASRGNPAHLLELAQHLVRQEVVTHVDGTWVLPQDVADDVLAFSRLDALASRLDTLSDMARVAARILSVRQGLLSLPMCLALTDLEAKDLYPALSGLVTEGVLIGADEGYRFADEQTRLALYTELSPSSQRAARGRLGALLLASEKLSRLEELEAHTLLLDQDHSEASAARITQLTTGVMLHEPDNMGPAAPLIELAYKSFKAKGRSNHELVRLIAALAVAGYFSDRKFLARYADNAVQTLGSVLRVPLMVRLQPFLGLKLSFYIGMILATIGFKKHKDNACVPSLKETTMLFMNLLTSLAGASTIQIDPFTTKKYADMMRPWTALGPKSPAAIPYKFVLCLAATTGDRVGSANASWKPLIARLRDPAQCEGLPEATRLRFLGGALYASGVSECWRDGPEALRIADELENFPIKFYRMSADQLRTVYYSNQGNLELFEHYRRRSELHAIQRGSAWQVELWSPSASITVHLRTADALGMKQSIEQVQRLVKNVPSLALLLERARGAYMLLRKHFVEAVPVLERCLEEPEAAVVGWARAHGALARALNALGLHERARDACLRAVRALTPEDLLFPAMNLGVQVELALAHAGLGQHALAVSQLDALLAQHTPNNGPLTLGALHEARARVAMWMNDEPLCRTHLAEMEKFFRGTEVPSLIARTEGIAKEVRRHFALGREPESMTLDGSYVAPTSTASTHTATGVTLIERELTQASSLPDFAKRALRVLIEGLPGARAALWVVNGQQLDLQASTSEEELPRELTDWVQERCAAAQADDVTQTAIVDDVAAGNPDVLVSQGCTYRLSFLRGGYADQELTGVVITGSSDASAGVPSAYVLETIGKKLKVQLKTLHTSIGTIH
jgi:tetratricopeptide (TPR) repeat protein